jgi:hypothetical protein
VAESPRQTTLERSCSEGDAAATAKPLEAELIPTLSSLEPVYGESSQLDGARLRFDRLGARFEAVYGARPALFARSPGRSTRFVSQGARARDCVSGDVIDLGPPAAAMALMLVQGGSI